MSTETNQQETTTFKEKPNELKIFKTRKEIKECKEEGRVSPTKKLMDSFLKKIPHFTSFKSCNISHQQVKSQSPQRQATTAIPDERNSAKTNNNKRPVEASIERKSPVKVPKAELSAPIPAKIDENLNNGFAPRNTSNNMANTKEESSNETSNQPCQNEILSDDPKESTVQSNGIESRISQTIIMKKKRADSSADALILQRLNPSPTKFNEFSKDMFVFTAPNRAKVSATVTLDRPPKLASQETKLSGATSTSAIVDALATEARSSSSNTLVPHSATNSVKSGSSCTLISTVSSSSGPVLNASVGNTLTVTTAGTAMSNNTNLSTNTISTTYSATSLPPAMPSSQSTNSVANPSNGKTPSSSFADKLSRSFFDLTQGSQDRLQKWKTKLQTGKRPQREKDGSEPPLNRKMSTLSGNFLGDTEVLVDWSTRDSPEKPRFLTSNPKTNEISPRPLHASKSASQALTRDFEPFIPTISPSLSKHNSLRESEMEHRTLKHRDNYHSGSDKNLSMHYQNMKNLQQLVQTIEGYSNDKNRSIDLDLPPPARIMPFSGIKPQDDGIIRPIAFRPNALNKNSADRQSFNSESASFFVKTPNSTSPSDSNVETKPLREQSKSISNLSSALAASNVMAPLRARPIPQASTSTNSSPGNITKRNTTRQVEEENEYDTVPEYIDNKYFSENENHGNAPEAYSHIYPYQQPSSQSSLNRRSYYSNSTDTGNSSKSEGNHAPSNTTSNNAIHTNSPQSASNGIRKSASGVQQQNGNNHRHSFGLHITPSPSDSGIVDYETLIRDKENELSNVRQAMEHNEEALVRVYQEKEIHYKDQIVDLKQRLQVSQQGEATLRQQLSIAEDQRKSLQNTIQSLNNDKRMLQQKCQQIERELYNIRNRFDDFVRETSMQQQRTAGLCENCLRQKSSTTQNSSLANESFYENGFTSMDRRGTSKAPMPAPRLSKDTSIDRELRSEVEDLRSEISTLRDQLNNQIQFFAEERRRWENERANIARPPPHGVYDVRNNNEQDSSNVVGLINYPKNPYRPEKHCAVLYGNDRLI
uniref:Uncharacterized protein n=1 Tax=Acrobeloides nanus TaxID=290746 RepID=A0A914EE96_9BILA